MTVVDLSHKITDKTITYEGFPTPEICDFWSRSDSANNYSDGSSFHIASINMVANTGTYIDTPFHRFENGKDLSAIAIEQLVNLKGQKFTFLNKKEVTKTNLSDLDTGIEAVLIQTNWSKYWGVQTYFHDHPYLSEDAADFMIKNKVKVVGIDSYNIDNTKIDKRPVHTKLLQNDILIIEHMTNLSACPSTDFKLTVLPPAIKGVGSFPVRPVAIF